MSQNNQYKYMSMEELISELEKKDQQIAKLYDQIDRNNGKTYAANKIKKAVIKILDAVEKNEINRTDLLIDAIDSEVNFISDGDDGFNIVRDLNDDDEVESGNITNIINNLAFSIIRTDLSEAIHKESKKRYGNRDITALLGTF